MRKSKIAFSVALCLVFGWGVATLAKPPGGGGGGGTGNCKRAVCAQCPEGYHLTGTWPDCCVCVPN